jgi:Ca-activated chloride channel homolog
MPPYLLIWSSHSIQINPHSSVTHHRRNRVIKTEFAFSQAVIPTKTASTVDLLVRFRAEIEKKPRRRLNLSLVIDRSGSMAGSPLRHALQAAQAVIDLLEPDDIISIVTFDDTISTIIPPQHPTDKKALKDKIRGVRAGGATNLSGGWIEGCKHVKAKHDPQKLNRVLLLTDGEANDGITSPKILTNTAREKMEEGIVTTTLGFGSGFNEDLLIGMARAASGNFYYIQSTDEATQVFEIELESLKSVVAQNLMATLTLEPGVSIAEVLSLAKTETKGNQIVLTLGDVYEGEDKILGLTLNLPEYASAGAHTALKLEFTADAIQDDAIKATSGELTVSATAGSSEDAMSASGTGITAEIARLRVARAKESALELSDAKKHAEAEKILRDLIADLRSKGLHENFEIAEEIEQLEYFANRIGKKNLSGDARKEMLDQSFQGLRRNRADLTGRGSTGGDDVVGLPVLNDAGAGVELVCIREGGKLRVKTVSPGYDDNMNVQFPRAIRAEGVRYVVDRLEHSSDGSFYRAVGTISRLLRPGETDTYTAPRRSSVTRTGKASTAPDTAADLPTTDEIGDGVLVQVVKDGSKLRARVVSDGFDHTWNMRFPRSIREDGMLYVVDEVTANNDGKSYIACGTIKRFVQT